MPEAPGGPPVNLHFDEGDIWPVAQLCPQRGMDSQGSLYVVPCRKLRNNISQVSEPATGAGGETVKEEVHHRPGMAMP